MTENQFVSKLSNYMPMAACAIAHKWVTEYPVNIKISKPRKTKLGDFRPNALGNGHAQISVNGDLNPYSFLITFTHEIAHLIDFTKRKSLKEPHGDSWKIEYQHLLVELLTAEVFPSEIRPDIINHINRPKAASCSDPRLLKALRRYDSESHITLNDIPFGATFSTSSNRKFIKGELRRTRYRCEEVSTGRFYLIHGESKIDLI